MTVASVVEKEIIFRHLAGNPTARRIAERMLELEDQETEKERSGESKYPWPGATRFRP